MAAQARRVTVEEAQDRPVGIDQQLKVVGCQREEDANHPVDAILAEPIQDMALVLRQAVRIDRQQLVTDPSGDHQRRIERVDNICHDASDMAGA